MTDFDERIFSYCLEQEHPIWICTFTNFQFVLKGAGKIGSIQLPGLTDNTLIERYTGLHQKWLLKHALLAQRTSGTSLGYIYSPRSLQWVYSLQLHSGTSLEYSSALRFVVLFSNSCNVEIFGSFKDLFIRISSNTEHTGSEVVQTKGATNSTSVSGICNRKQKV